MFYLPTLFQQNGVYSVERNGDNKLERIWKEAVAA
jgi:hypothetical protein